MSKMILKHVTHTLPEKVEYFYDGLLIAKNGLIEVDTADEPHVRALWLRGYRLTADGDPLYDWSDYLKYVKTTKNKVTTTA